MKLVLHIGTHKTGSTLIQEVCKALHEELRQTGIFYPVDGFSHAGHHELAWCLKKNDLDGARSIWNKILTDASECDCILLSSEEFEFLHKLDVVEKLFSGMEVEVVVYLRRQDDYLESEYNQHVKMYSTRFDADIFQFYMFYNFESRFNYRRIVSAWERTGIVSRMRVLSYDIEAGEGNMLGSLFSEFGLDSNLYKDRGAQKVNSSIPANALIYLARLNQRTDISPDYHSRFIKCLGAQGVVFSRGASANTLHYRFLNEELSRRLIKKFENSNDFISRKYLKRSDAFKYKKRFDYNIVDFYRDFDVALYDRLLHEIGIEGGGANGAIQKAL